MKKYKKLIYFDVCVLSRPFDDQSFLRIRLETEAANLILSKVRNEEYGLVISPIHLEEIKAISDAFERIELQERLKAIGKSVKIDFAVAKKRAEELYDLKFGVADAAHVAFAEQCGAEFISCDDALIKKCSKHNINPNIAKVEGAADPRRQGCSCSNLPQALDNAGDAVSSAFPLGK